MQSAEIDNNSGILVVQESREIAQKLKDYYRNEYNRLKSEQKKNNISYIKKQIMVGIGNIGVKIGLLFTKKPVKKIGRVATNIATFVTSKILKYKNKQDNKEFDRKLKQLEADFLNCEGEFKKIAIETSKSDGQIYLETDNTDVLSK